MCTQRHTDCPGSESGSLSWGCCCQLLGEVGKSSRHKVQAKPRPTATGLLWAAYPVGGWGGPPTRSSRHPPGHPFPAERLQWEVAGREGTHWTWLCQHLWCKDQCPGPGRLGEGRQPICTGAGEPGGLQRPMFSLLLSAGSMGPHVAQQVLKPRLRPPAYSPTRRDLWGPLRLLHQGPVRRQRAAGGSICRKRQLCWLFPAPSHPPSPVTGLMRCLALGFFPLFTNRP